MTAGLALAMCKEIFIARVFGIEYKMLYSPRALREKVVVTGA